MKVAALEKQTVLRG